MGDTTFVSRRDIGEPLLSIRRRVNTDRMTDGFDDGEMGLASRWTRGPNGT
jgi:hypothetical protein